MNVKFHPVSKSKLIYNHPKHQMLKNAESKSGFRRRGSQRFPISKASFMGKENRFTANGVDPKNKSLRALSKRKTDRSTQILQKKENIPNNRLKPLAIHSRNKRKSNGQRASRSRNMDLSCFENINLNSERREPRRAKIRKPRASGELAKRGKKGARKSELTYTRKSSSIKGRRRALRTKALNEDMRENIYEGKGETRKRPTAKPGRKSKNGNNQSIYDRSESTFGKQNEWNYQSMKNVFKANSPDFGGKVHVLSSQNFQTLNPNSLIRSQEAKKRLQRPSISKMEKFGNFKGNALKPAAHAMNNSKENPQKMYSKIFSKKEIENLVKVNSNKCTRLETDQADKGKRNQLDDFFRNLDLRSEKPLKPRGGTKLINQVGQLVKQSCQRKSYKENAKMNQLTSLIKQSQRTFESVEKMILESKMKRKETGNIFETIYKDKPRPDSKNNNRRRKSSRASGNSKKGLWGQRRREDSGRNYRKISKWMNHEKKQRAKADALDIENSLYCKKNLKRIGQHAEFNVPEAPKTLNQPSTMDLKDAERGLSRRENQAEVRISSFFKESRNNSEKNINNSKAIKEETPEIQKKAVMPQVKAEMKPNPGFCANGVVVAEAKMEDNEGKDNTSELRIEEEDSETNFSSRNNQLAIESPSSKKAKSFFVDVPATYQFKNNFKDILSHHISKIVQHIGENEGKCSVKLDYFKKKQKQVDPKMREVLVDWLMEVHSRYKMRDETIFLAVRLIDKYLSLRPIEYDRFQLLGTASLMIAAKYEEIYPPKVKDFVYICANAYTRADVLKMEARILHLVNFDLVFPTSVQFFGFFRKLFKFEDTIKNLTLYILYGSLVSQNFCQTNPRLLAYSAVIMANKAFKNYEGIKKFKESVVGKFKDSDVNLCIFQIYNMMLSMKKSELSALRTKFSSEKYGNISQIQQRVH